MSGTVDELLADLENEMNGVVARAAASPPPSVSTPPLQPAAPKAVALLPPPPQPAATIAAASPKQKRRHRRSPHRRSPSRRSVSPAATPATPRRVAHVASPATHTVVRLPGSARRLEVVVREVGDDAAWGGEEVSVAAAAQAAVALQQQQQPQRRGESPLRLPASQPSLRLPHALYEPGQVAEAAAAAAAVAAAATPPPPTPTRRWRPASIPSPPALQQHQVAASPVRLAPRKEPAAADVWSRPEHESKTTTPPRNGVRSVLVVSDEAAAAAAGAPSPAPPRQVPIRASIVKREGEELGASFRSDGLLLDVKKGGLADKAGLGAVNVPYRLAGVNGVPFCDALFGDILWSKAVVLDLVPVPLQP